MTTSSTNQPKFFGPAHLQLVALVALLVCAAWSNSGHGAANGSESVWCYNERLNLVARKPRFRCQDEVVSDARAAEIKRERSTRIKRGFNAGFTPPEPGVRLTGTGSSFFVSDQGHLLTNAHVVRTCRIVTVTPKDGEQYRVKVIAAQAEPDLALLRSEAEPAEVAVFSPEQTLALDSAIGVVGFPSRGRISIRPAQVVGRVHPTLQVDRAHYLPLAMDIRSGHSGAPVMDQSARVVGVVYAAVNTAAVYARTGKRVRRVGMGVSSALALAFMRKHGVSPRVSRTVRNIKPAARFALAIQYVAQVRCWE
jgi:serine protease Do